MDGEIGYGWKANIANLSTQKKRLLMLIKFEVQK